MTVAHYFRRVRRLWWVLAVATVLGLGLSVLGYQSQTPRYVAVSQLSIGHSGATVGDELEAHNLSVFRAEALAGVADKAPVIQRAMEQAGVSGPPPQVTARALGNSSLVVIAVVDTDPVRAAKVANGLSAVLPTELGHLVGPLDRGLALHVTLVAVPAATPFAPVKKRWLELGLVLGIALGLAVIGAAEALDRSVRDGGQLAAATGRPLLAVIPRRGRLAAVLRWPGSLGRQTESVRRLRSAVMSSGARTVAVTSALRGEGRTSVVTDLAAAIRAAGLRVLIVEADLRRPRLAGHYGIRGDVGLAEVLDRGISVRTAIQDPGDAPMVLVAGDPVREDSDLFVGERFSQLVADLGAQVDLVLIDAPDIARTAATGLICAAADATIVVARLGQVTPGSVRSALQTLDRAQVTVLGVVANGSRGGSAADATLRARHPRGLRRWRRG